MKSSIVCLITILLLVFGGRLNAQILMSKPYLKVTNTISGNIYKLKKGKKIEYLMLHDSVYRKGIINGFIDSNLINVSGTPVNINDFVYLKFKPLGKFKRIFKIYFYSVFVGYVGYIFLSPEEESVKLIMAAASPLLILGGEFYGVLFQLLTPKRELHKDYNLKLKVVN